MNVGMLTFVGVGFLVGFRHAFEPDHLAAVTTLATRGRGLGHAARLGVAWGIGHTASVAIVAVALIVLGVHVPDRFYRIAEMGVALLLVLLGVSTLWAKRGGTVVGSASRTRTPTTRTLRIRTTPASGQ